MRKRILLSVTVLSSALACGVAACSDDDNTTGPVDAGKPVDSTVPPVDAAKDTGPAVDAAPDASDSGVDADAGREVNHCKEADFADADYRADAAVRLITFSFDASTDNYAPPCMMIRTGQSVTWQGNFQAHPLGAFNGDPNNPVEDPEAGSIPDGSYTRAFANPGWFGYQCQTHANMVGAIMVQP
jgi:plastocyanin